MRFKKLMLILGLVALATLPQLDLHMPIRFFLPHSV
jgi:hypothetical protein